MSFVWSQDFFEDFILVVNFSASLTDAVVQSTDYELAI